MRDPKRISQMLYYLNKIWQKQPDTRFNQLIHNLQWEFNNAHDKKYSDALYRKQVITNGVNELGISFEVADVVDLFYVEDEQFIKFLEFKVKKLYPEEEL